jgi:hypothetical protein
MEGSFQNLEGNDNVDENFAMDDITKHKVIKTAEYFIT